MASEERSRMWGDIWEVAIILIFIPLGFAWAFIFSISLLTKFFGRRS
jgi:hypothetical protein